jgi:hypothetical protein
MFLAGKMISSAEVKREKWGGRPVPQPSIVIVLFLDGPSLRRPGISRRRLLRPVPMRRWETNYSGLSLGADITHVPNEMSRLEKGWVLTSAYYNNSLAMNGALKSPSQNGKSIGASSFVKPLQGSRTIVGCGNVVSMML